MFRKCIRVAWNVHGNRLDQGIKSELDTWTCSVNLSPDRVNDRYENKEVDVSTGGLQETE